MDLNQKLHLAGTAMTVASLANALLLDCMTIEDRRRWPGREAKAARRHAGRVMAALAGLRPLPLYAEGDMEAFLADWEA